MSDQLDELLSDYETRLQECVDGLLTGLPEEGTVTKDVLGRMIRIAFQDGLLAALIPDENTDLHLLPPSA